VAIALFCIYDFLKSREYPSGLARPVRLRAAGILLFASLYLQRAFLRKSSAGLQIELMVVAFVGGGLLLFWGSKKTRP